MGAVAMSHDFRRGATVGVVADSVAVVGEVGGLRSAGTAIEWGLVFPVTSPGVYRLPWWEVPGLRSLLAIDAEFKRFTTWTLRRGDPAELPTPVPLFAVETDAGTYRWNGATWVSTADPATEGNTLAELQANIGHSSLAAVITGGRLRLVWVPVTTDRRVTSRLACVSLAVEVEQIDATDDAVEALVAAIEALDVDGSWSDTASTELAAIDLVDDAVRSTIPYAYTEIRGVYDLDAAPTVNLYAGGFTPGAKVTHGAKTYTSGTVALTAPIPAGNAYRVDLVHRVPARRAQHRDLGGVPIYELTGVPEVQVRDPRIVGTVEVRPAVVVSDRGSSPPLGVVITGARDLVIEVTLAPRAEMDDDVVPRVGAAIRRWLGDATIVSAPGTGRAMTVEVLDPGQEVPEDEGRLVRHDLVVRLYSARELGTANQAEVLVAPTGITILERLRRET